MVLQEAEVNLDGCGHGHRFAVLHAGTELPLADCLDSLFVEPQPEGSHYFDIAGMAGGVHLHIENYSPLIFFLKRFL